MLILTEAYKRIINQAYKELKEGRDFGAVAAAFSSDDAVRVSQGELGFVSAFTLPYDIENTVFGLKAGSFSTPVKTTIG